MVKNSALQNKNFIVGVKDLIPAVNDSPYKRILAIGDVHATFDKLTSLWKKLSVTDDDLVIFLGDYLCGTNDGNKNVETLHWLIEHKKRKNIIFLRGNVDETYIHSLFDSNGNFFCKPNSKVARAINAAAFKEPYFTQEIYDFLTGLPLYHSITIGGRKYFFCHAGIDIGTPLEAQTKRYLLDHPKLKDFYRDYSGDTIIVVGHKSPKKIFEKLPRLFTNSKEKLDLNKPLKVPDRNIIMLDLHAKEDGALSCVDILTGEYWQSGSDNAADSVGSILFVCSGNTCRSPMAKYIMRHLLAQNGLADKVIVDSAGCNTRGGSPMAKMAHKVLTENDIPKDIHLSKTFTLQEYEKFQCVVALDRDILLQAKKISRGDPDKKIRLFTDANGKEMIVDDPLGTGDSGYRRAYREIFKGCSSLVKDCI